MMSFVNKAIRFFGHVMHRHTNACNGTGYNTANLFFDEVFFSVIRLTE